MRTVTVNASRTYEVKIGPGLLAALPQEIHRLGNVTRVMVVSDSNVFPLYGKAVLDALTQNGFTADSFVFPAGEESKSLNTYGMLLEQLGRCRLSRSDLIVALGGGVVGDLAGFAAATYLRGIRFVQIPTTLLAAVDSSVGGKTAVDLPSGKNQAGAFWQPSLVLCDTDTLSTLPEDIFRDGCAEVIKYAILYDPDFFDYLESAGLAFHREAVIARCVELKRDVVNEDEFDTGARMKLNLGHTIGHGVEAGSDFTVSHGKAVAIGTAIVSRASGCPDAPRIIRLLGQFGLPTATGMTSEALFGWVHSDKKRSGQSVKLIIPRAIGSCEIVPTPVENLRSFIEAGL